MLAEMDLATQSFERATQLDPNDPYLRAQLGWSYFSQGAYRSAVAEYEAPSRWIPSMRRPTANWGSPTM